MIHALGDLLSAKSPKVMSQQNINSTNRFFIF